MSTTFLIDEVFFFGTFCQVDYLLFRFLQLWKFSCAYLKRNIKEKRMKKLILILLYSNPQFEQSLKITEKGSFNIVTYVYILSGQKLIKNGKNLQVAFLVYCTFQTSSVLLSFFNSKLHFQCNADRITVAEANLRKEEIQMQTTTVFENHRKSLLQHFDRIELRLRFEWTKLN